MQVYCIIGDERAYRAKSTLLFTRLFQRMGIQGAYVPFKVDPRHLGQAMQSLRILNIAGANVTAPYKEAVLPYLDVLSEGANIIGAVNTIVRTGDKLKGYNTNAIGFMDALSDHGFDAEDKSALVFGTGGVAKAVVFILNWLRTKTIFVTGRDETEARRMVERFGGEAVSLSGIKERTPSIHILVNATSISSKDDSPELDALARTLDLPHCELVMDLNYDRPRNLWQQMASDRSIRFADGLKPLAYQARRTLALWTGLQVSPAEFVSALSR